MAEFNEREQKEIDFARLYAKNFSHGTDGHNRLLLIAKLADELASAGKQSNDQIAVIATQQTTIDMLRTEIERLNQLVAQRPIRIRTGDSTGWW